jgi:transcriptional accessory protein Tex/SPT6
MAARSVRPRFSLHSMKRGAITKLWEQCAAAGLEPAMVPFIAKHRSAMSAIIPDNTIGYAANLYHVAHALGTHKYSILL